MRPLYTKLVRYALLFSTTSILLTACVTSGGNKVPGKWFPPTSPEHVQVFYQEPSRPYQIVGFVSVDRAVAGADTVIERKFRTVAATMGADAVLIEALPKATVLGAQVQGKAKAIKWK